jgi:hypothetical protein
MCIAGSCLLRRMFAGSANGVFGSLVQICLFFNILVLDFKSLHPAK